MEIRVFRQEDFEEVITLWERCDRLLDALLGQLVCRKSMELVWFLDRSH